MTKQQPCASKLRISKICRVLIALGIAKLALVGAWTVDMPLPQFISPDQKASSRSVLSAPVAPPGDALPKEDTTASPGTRKAEEVRLSTFFAESRKSTESKESSGRPLFDSFPAENRASPVQDASVVRSAAPLPSMPAVHLPWSMAARAEAEAASNTGERPLASGVDPDRPTAPVDGRETAVGINLLREITSLAQLPMPALGVRQVAHAAAMDMPTPQARPSAPAASPFTPPEQAQVRPNTPPPGGQESSGAPLPLRPRPNVPQAEAGVPAPGASAMSAPPAPAARNFASPESPEIKQQELTRREQDVLMLKQQMEARLQELQSAEKKVQGMLKEAHGVHEQKIKHLITAYTNMKPKQAALALESLDERLAVRILAGMNPKQAGEMLTYANPKTVAKLTELLARMQLPGE
jgi:flagellar motility protein MotE (MotC chaperone)